MNRSLVGHAEYSEANASEPDELDRTPRGGKIMSDDVNQRSWCGLVPRTGIPSIDTSGDDSDVKTWRSVDNNVGLDVMILAFSEDKSVLRLLHMSVTEGGGELVGQSDVLVFGRRSIDSSFLVLRASQKA